MGLANLGVFSLFLIVGLPLLSIIFSISRLLFATKVSKPLKYGVSGLSVLAWIGFFAAGSILAGSFSAEKKVEVLSSTVENDILEIVTENNFKDWGDSYFKINGGNFKMYMNNGQLITQDVQLIFNESEDENITILQKVHSRGSDMQEVETLTTSLNYQLDLTDNKLTIPTHFAIPHGAKYRGQKIIIDIYVPKGKSIRLGENVLDLNYWFKTNIQKSSTGECPTLTMTEKGFVCPDDVKATPENKTETI